MLLYDDLELFVMFEITLSIFFGGVDANEVKRPSLTGILTVILDHDLDTARGADDNADNHAAAAQKLRLTIFTLLRSAICYLLTHQGFDFLAEFHLIAPL